MKMKFFLCFICILQCHSYRLRGQFYYKENLINQVDVALNVNHCTEDVYVLFEFNDQINQGYLGKNGIISTNGLPYIDCPESEITVEIGQNYIIKQIGTHLRVEEIKDVKTNHDIVTQSISQPGSLQVSLSNSFNPTSRQTTTSSITISASLITSTLSSHTPSSSFHAIFKNTFSSNSKSISTSINNFFYGFIDDYNDLCYILIDIIAVIIFVICIIFLQKRKVIDGLFNISTKFQQSHPLQLMYPQHKSASTQPLFHQPYPSNHAYFQNILAPIPAIPLPAPALQQQTFFSESELANASAPPLPTTEKFQQYNTEGQMSTLSQGALLSTQINNHSEIANNTNNIYCYCIGACTNCKCIQAGQNCNYKCHKGRKNNNCQN